MAESKNFDYHEAFSRNVGFVSKDELEVLRNSCIAIPGMGGVGGAHAEFMVRQGIGNFKIADFDTFELANFNRQLGASMNSVGRKKNDVIAERILSINPEAKVDKFDKGISVENLDEFLEGVDVVIDSLDAFCVDIRRHLFRRAKEKGIPVVSAGPLGFSSIFFAVLPDSMAFDDYFDMHDEMSDDEKFIHFVMGIAPKGLHLKYLDMSSINVKEHKAPSSPIGVALCAASAGAAVLKLILKRGVVRPLPHYSQCDFYLGQWVQKKLWWGNRNPWQKVKISIAKKRML